MIIAFLVGFSLPTVPFLLGLGLLALVRHRQGYSMQEARYYTRLKGW